MSLRILLMWILLPALLLAETASDVVNKSEALYAKAGNFSAKFTQVVSTGDFFDDEKTSGVLIMSYPVKFRIETPEQVIASDGDTIWSFSAENKQVTIEALAKSTEIVTPADYLFRFKQNYNLDYDSTDTIGKAIVHRVHLTSKSDDQFVRAMNVYIDANTYQVRRVIYRDINDNKITLEFSDWKMGTRPGNDQFRFKTPKGVEEVRLP